ncbi:hypothetical protein TI03_07535, partial [Achromatium sp. WMS1]
ATTLLRMAFIKEIANTSIVNGATTPNMMELKTGNSMLCVASIRGERDIAVGNIIGSNIFNILAVLGATSMVASNGIPVSIQTQQFDIPIMIAAAISCLPIFFTDHVVSRWEGALLFGYYVIYMIYLFLLATQSIELPVFNSIIFGVVAPLTILVLAISLIKAIRSRVVA